MLQFPLVNALANFLSSPVGPVAVLILGVVALITIGRQFNHPRWQRGLALSFWAIAAWQVVYLRVQSVVPVYSQPWQPFLLRGTNLLWVGDGWNWYASFLVILLGGIVLLLNGLDSYAGALPSRREIRRNSIALASHLGVTATALLFVGSGNLLTVTLTWVLMDVFVLARNALVPPRTARLEPGKVVATGESPLPQANYSHGLSLLGALLLLIGLLPAGVLGPGQPLQGGDLPSETVLLMVVAAAIRAGAYPFHFWLLPAEPNAMKLSERFSGHMIPALCGLWLLGWSIGLGSNSMLLRPEFVSIGLLTMLGSALAAFMATDQAEHTTFVLITSVSLAGLAGLCLPPTAQRL